MGWVMSEGHDDTLGSSRQHGSTPGECVPTVVGHGEDGDLGDGAVATLDSAGSLVDGGQICVHVTRETPPAGDLLSGCRHLGNERHRRRQIHNVELRFQWE